VEQLRDQLLDVDGVYTTDPAALPRPLATMLRSWARARAAEDLQASLCGLSVPTGDPSRAPLPGEVQVAGVLTVVALPVARQQAIDSDPT
jgi:hypothetical protein